MAQLVALTTNQCGVLARVTSAISATGANIRHCQVSEMPDASTALITIDVHASEPQLAAIRRKLIRLIDVIHLQSDFRSAEETYHIAEMLRAESRCRAIA